MEYFEQKETNYLMHHGILGMRWGVRRFQNKDGSLTAEGRSRLGYRERKIEKYKSQGMSQEEAEAKYDRRKKAIMIGAGVAGGILAVYGGGTSTANYLSAVKRYNNTPKGVKKRMADRRKNWKVQKISRGGIGNYKEAAAQSNKETAENVLRYMKRYNSIAKLSKGK